MIINCGRLVLHVVQTLFQIVGQPIEDVFDPSCRIIHISEFGKDDLRDNADFHPRQDKARNEPRSIV